MRKNNQKKSKELKLIYAFDPKIKRRVVYAVIGDYAVSLLSGHKVKTKSLGLG